MLKNHRPLVGLVIVGVLVCTVVFADDAATKGRDILEKNKDAVVTVQLVIKQQYSAPGSGTQENEMNQEVTGTVIGPDGLTVVSLSAIDPSHLYRSIMGNQDGFSSSVDDIKILVEDGKELVAKEVLRDNDLDLAFVRPTETPEKPMTYVDLKAAASPEILEQIITLNRLGQVARRAHSASVERISSVVTKPRTFYIPGSDATTTNLGSPAFSLDGKIIGIFVLRAIKTSTSGGGRGGTRDNVSPIIVPAEDILEGAQQAAEIEGEVADE